MSTRPTLLLRALGVALLAALMLATPAVAQDDDQDDDDDRHGGATTTTTAGSRDELGSYIHEGTCEAIGAEIDEIEDLERHDDDDDHDDDGDDDRHDHDRIWQRIGGEGPRPDRLWAEDDDVDPSLQELTAGEFVITVHEDEDSDSPVIACGAIAGTRDADGGLLIDLAEVDASGFEGRAYLLPDADDDDDETEIWLGVWEVQSAGV